MNLLPFEIDKSSPLPIYFQLSRGIQNLIRSGQLTPGDALPSENELSQAYHISPMTVRQGMAELVKEGYIHRERGRGTFVSLRRMQHQLENFVSFSESMRARELTPGSQLLLIEPTSPPGDVVDKVNISAPAKFTRIKRVRLANETPVGIHDSYLNGIPITPDELEQTPSLYELLESKGVFLNEGEETIEATCATEEIAALLNIEAGAPLLRAVRFSWDAAGNFIEYVVALYHADLYRYTIRLKR